MKKVWSIAVLLLLGLAGLLAWMAWRERPASPLNEGSAPVARVEPRSPAASAAASAPGVQHPIEPPADADTKAPIDTAAVLTELFGRRTVLSMLQVEDFPRRFVATTINLASSRATSRLWPLVPPAGRFTVEQRADGAVVSPDNGLRYAPFVLLIETVDLHQAVAAYRRLYPQLQQAYEELGYPRGYFNDQLVATIDLLVSTPDLEQPARVHLPISNSPVQPERPWVLYEFDDPSLESLAAGQKILLRMGPVNERRIKARLLELRGLLTAAKAGR